MELLSMVGTINSTGFINRFIYPNPIKGGLFLHRLLYLHGFIYLFRIRMVQYNTVIKHVKKPHAIN